MAKAYVCDACGVAMADPYEAKMREFYVGVKFDYGHAFPCNVKTPKCKIHLCDDCYRGLHDVAARKRGADNG